jgi:hypothetical protein
MKRPWHFQRKLQASGMLVLLGLSVEAVCLLWSRPIAFVILASVGGLLVVAGVLLFLYSLAFVDSHPEVSKTAPSPS